MRVAMLSAILLAIVFTIAYRYFFGSSALAAMRDETRAHLRQLEDLLITYRSIHGEYPAETSDFVSLLPRARVSHDLWGTPIRYTLVDGQPVLTSAAQDLEFGTKDDIIETD